MKTVCEFCGTPFTTHFKNKKYCKPSCKQMAYLQRLGFRLSHTPAKEQYTPSSETKSIPILKVVQGDLFNTIKRMQRTQDLFTFSHSLFWPDRNFSEDEQLQYRLLIADHFKGSKDIDKTFMELVERSVIEKRWINEKAYHVIAEPEEWFSIHFAAGLPYTQHQYNKIVEQRLTVPGHQIGMTILAEAVLKYCEKKNVLDIYSYREQFIRLRQADLLQIYLNAVMHIQFINL